MRTTACPHCLAPARGDGRPNCLCAEAAAEEFDPLRLRPYVRLQEQESPRPQEQTSPRLPEQEPRTQEQELHSGGRASAERRPVDPASRQRPGPARSARLPGPGPDPEAGRGPGEAARLRPVPPPQTFRAPPGPRVPAAPAERHSRPAEADSAPGEFTRPAPHPLPGIVPPGGGLVRDRGAPPTPYGPRGAGTAGVPLRHTGPPRLAGAAPPPRSGPPVGGGPRPTGEAAPSGSAGSVVPFGDGSPTAGVVAFPSLGPSGRGASHRRRRKRAVIAGMVAAAATLGVTAVMVGGELVSDAYRDDAGPAPTSPDTAPPTAAPANPTGQAPAPSRSAAPSPGPLRTAPHAGEQAATSASAVRAPRTTHAAGRTAPTSSTSAAPHPPSASASASPPVLAYGDTGPEVVELQQRLRQVGVYPYDADGRYDARVRQAVSVYQQEYGVRGDPDGVYGAHTRASLESRTSQ